MKISELTNDNLNELCAYIINGGSPLDLCEKWGVEWNEMWLWIADDKERKAKYDGACHAQSEWAIATQ